MTLLFARPNISLSALSASPISFMHTRYVPPHPQQGTPYHRYVLLLVPQSSPTERITVPVPTDEDRLGFDFRDFAAKYGLDASKGGAVHMWREIWDETVSQIYRDVLSTLIIFLVGLLGNANDVSHEHRNGRAEIWSPAEGKSVRRDEESQKVHLMI